MTALTLLAVLTMPQSAVPAAEYARTWTLVRKAIEGRYYARQARGAEMKRLLDECEPKAKVARSREEFQRIVNDTIAEFKDSHFRLDIEGDQAFYVLGSFGQREPQLMANIGAWFRRAPDGYTVSMVLDGSEAEAAGLTKGDLVVTIDGAPFSPVHALEPFVGKRAKLQVKRGAQLLEADVTPVRQPAATMFLEASKRSARTIQAGGHRFGYYRSWTLMDNSFRAALAGAVGHLKDTDGFILDLRDGFGGRPEGFGDPFFPPANGGLGEGFYYSKPLVVLINGGSRSAKEMLGYNFRKTGRATLIGMRTAGHVLATAPIKVAPWASLMVPMLEVKVDGQRLEGVGVEPDIAVSAERDEQGRDLILQAGIEHLQKLLAQSGKAAA